MLQSPQLEAVYQRALTLQQQVDELPERHQALLSAALAELQTVLEELQAADEELRCQNEELVSTRQAVEAERQRYRELFEFAPNGYLVTDASGRIQEANYAAATLLKVAQSFLIHKPLYVFIHAPDRATFHLRLDQLQQLEKIQDWEISLCPRNGEPFVAALTVAPVRSADGRVVNLRWLLRDITERKRLQQLLEQLNSDLERQVQERTAQLQQALEFEAGLKRITDQVRDSLNESQILQTVVRELAQVLHLICCNTGLYDLDSGTSTIRYEFTQAAISTPSLALQGQTVSMATFPESYHQLLQGVCFQFCRIADPTRYTILACPIADQHGVLGDLWLFKSASEGFDELEMRLVQQVTNQCAIAIRQARLYEASQMQLQELKKLDQLKDTFLSTTSHELRSPVTNMKMAIQMLKIALVRERGASEEKKPAQATAVDRYLQILQTECDREINLINDLLDLQRLEAGETLLIMESIRLQDWLPDVVAPFYERARSRQQTLQVYCAPNLPPLNSHPATLMRILAELLNNACKYTPIAGFITITVQAQISTMQLQVSNTSLDIPNSELDRIFDKFYRIPNSDPWQQGGTGLGLALVQKLTTQLGGTIVAENTAGQLHFTVELPLMAA
jgi:PAS domain S-box-containing protein